MSRNNRQFFWKFVENFNFSTRSISNRGIHHGLKSRFGLILTGIALCMAFGLSGCTTNNATGKDSFTAFMSPEQEREIGQAENPKIIKEFGGTYTDKHLDAYVSKIGQKLVAVSETPDAQVTFTILNSPIVNAFALPGGYIYITRGLAALASNEAELAGVLAHELGHVVARHSAQRYSRAVLTGVFANGLNIVLGGGVGDIIDLGANAYMQSYSRENEFEADVLAVRYISRAGYSPEAMASFLKKLRAHSRLQSEIAGHSAETVDQYDIMATHPRTIDRIEQAKNAARINSDTDTVWNTVPYMTAIDGLLYGESPENGYVRGQDFIHVPFGFRFELPEGFAISNQQDAVIASNKDLVKIIFQVAQNPGKLSPKDYLRTKFSTKIRLGSIERLNINGNEGATGKAVLRTSSEKKIDVRAVAIRLKDQTYQFVFIMPEQLANQYNLALRRTTYSFRALNSREKQLYRPLRIKIRAVNPDADLQTFVNDMATDKKAAETFAVINGLEANERPRTGSLIKVISD